MLAGGPPGDGTFSVGLGRGLAVGRPGRIVPTLVNVSTTGQATSGPTTGQRLLSSLRGALRRNPAVDRTYRIAVGVVGGVVVALGIVLMPLPGPGALIVLAGLGILATEFEWAHRWSRRGTAQVRRLVARVRARRESRNQQPGV